MAIEFDGVNDVLDFGVAADALENLFSSNGTVAGWARFSATPDTATTALEIIGRAVSGGITGWFIAASTVDNTWGFVQKRATTNSIWNLGNGVSINTWYHFAITYNSASTATQPEFYQNGDTLLSTEVAGSAGAAGSDTAVSLTFGGDSAGALPFNGWLEDVRMYDFFLTQEQIRTLAAGYRSPLGGEILWVSGEEASGMTAWDGALLSTSTLVPDMSSLARSGTPEGANLTGRASDAPRQPRWSFFPIPQGQYLTSTLTGAISAAQMVGTIASRFLYLLKAFIGLDTTPTLDVTLDTTPTLSVSLDTTPTVDVEFGKAPTQP